MSVRNHGWYETCDGRTRRAAAARGRAARITLCAVRIFKGEHGMKRVCGTILVTATFLIACAANAAPITFFYTGHLTQIASLDPDSPFPAAITDNTSNPTTFAGSFTFNSFALDNIPGDPQSGSHASGGGAIHFTPAPCGLHLGFRGVRIGGL